MNSCECLKGVNGYYSWNCVTHKRQQCKSGTLPQVKCQTFTDSAKINQFEKTKKSYEKIDKNGNKITKTPNKTEKIEKSMTWGTFYLQIKSFRKQYLCHKYQVSNDLFHWQKILATVEDYGETYHMDFFENLCQIYKYEPQSSHFNKKQYSLHYTVKHTTDPDNPYEYIYRLSDFMKHIYVFTSAVVDHILEKNSTPRLIQFKSDNCATQDKSKYVFWYWSNLAAQHGKKVLLYYGVAGHGRGLVDAMSSFGVKAPHRKAVITNEFTCSSALDIHKYLNIFFQNDNQKHHHYLDKSTIDLILKKRKRNL